MFSAVWYKNCNIYVNISNKMIFISFEKKNKWSLRMEGNY